MSRITLSILVAWLLLATSAWAQYHPGPPPEPHHRYELVATVQSLDPEMHHITVVTSEGYQVTYRIDRGLVGYHQLRHLEPGDRVWMELRARDYRWWVVEIRELHGDRGRD